MAAPTNAANVKKLCQLGAVHTWHRANIEKRSASDPKRISTWLVTMPVVHVGRVRVCVPQRRMPMEMRVRFAGRVERAMVMTMVLIVHVRVGVRRGLVHMLVFVMFGQVQPYANRHQGN